MVRARHRRWFEEYFSAVHDVIDEKLAAFTLSHELGQSFEVATPPPPTPARQRNA